MSHGTPGRVPVVLNKAEILDHLTELADELAGRNLSCRLVVVGGSYLALHDLRESTADVDSLTRLTKEVKSVVRQVGERQGLKASWLNDSAAMFSPAGLDLDHCEVVYEHSHLMVLCPPAQQIFLMKLLASRAPDHDDMIALWPRCGFVSAQAAVDAYYLAYPFEEHDPFLVDYVQQIAELAGG
ncbi:DUF6036 family nucleotidyltransferase [Kribbella solani]|uniref:DUF6036 family nucleotidyltransferase n=1 Tax=Kribbella solani TaxID=236067 RepID=UPI0029A25011|nr:DUF6036 family nucleotidyltransferase [Kribbella solani]MDX3004270.1 DUF6036 family nucleotidyltransferase [Kribbella solani]